MSHRTAHDWEEAILSGYAIFRQVNREDGAESPSTSKLVRLSCWTSYLLPKKSV